MVLKKLFPILALLPLLLFADKAPLSKLVKEDDGMTPWLTGPLLAPSSLVIPGGYYNFEPYIYITANTGTYNDDWHAVRNEHTFWSNSFQPTYQVGLTPWLDFQILPTVFYNYTDGVGNWAFGDLLIEVDFQLFTAPISGSWLPNVKLQVKETIPTGKYHHLNPRKLNTDVGGNGSFQTGFGLVFGKLIHFSGVHFMTYRLLMQYVFPSAVRLRGYNVYGGAADTNVKFFPAQSAEVDLGFEFTLTRHWVFALDLVMNWAEGANYSGDPGTGIGDNPAMLGSASPSFQYSIAPAIEYNWNGKLGVIFGPWITVAGKNSVQFCSGVFALNYYY